MRRNEKAFSRQSLKQDYLAKMLKKFKVNMVTRETYLLSAGSTSMI